MKQRIEYLDAMRGFTMVLVVFSHILLCTFQMPEASGFSFNDIFVTFRMPLFYFLSGFLMFKPDRFKNLNGTIDFIKKKFVVQIIPTVIFSLVFCLVFAKPYIGLLNDPAKHGFWFTYTLFFYFLIYSIGDWLIGKICSGKAKLAIGILGTISVYALAKYSLSNACPWHGSHLYNWIGLNNLQFFLFFFFGATVKRWFNEFQAILDSKQWMAFILSTFIVLQLILQVPSCKNAMISVSYSLYSLVKSLSGFFGITIVFAFFRKYQDAFSKKNIIGSALQYIGTRTLDIYFLHLFLIYVNLAPVGKLFATYHNPVLELFAGLAMSLLVIGLCLVISNVIRCSDFLAKYLFGKVIPVEK